VLVVAVIGSPHAGGRTRVAVDAVLSGAAQEGAETRVVELADTSVPDAVAALGEADAAVFASPTYRADITAQLKALLDATPRGMKYESGDALRGTVCATVLTGASDHHFLAVEKVRGILGGFFGAQLLSPGLYSASSSRKPILTVTCQSATRPPSRCPRTSVISNQSMLRSVRSARDTALRIAASTPSGEDPTISAMR